MSLFFFNDTATTEIYTLSLHDALPICPAVAGTRAGVLERAPVRVVAGPPRHVRLARPRATRAGHTPLAARATGRSARPGGERAPGCQPTAHRRVREPESPDHQQAIAPAGAGRPGGLGAGSGAGAESRGATRPRLRAGAGALARSCEGLRTRRNRHWGRHLRRQVP